MNIKQLLHDGTISSLVIFVTIFALIKIILVPELRRFKRAVASIFVGLPTGVLAGLVCVEQGMDDAMSIAVGCFAALVSENLIVAIIESDMKYVVNSLVKKIIGRV